MKKLFHFLIFFLSLPFFIFLTGKAYAIDGTYNPTSVTYGQKVSVSINWSGIPSQPLRIGVASTGLDLNDAESQKTNNINVMSDCSGSIGASDGWSETNCSVDSNGRSIFTAKFNTSSIPLPENLVTSVPSYSMYVNAVQAGSFNIVSSTPTPTPTARQFVVYNVSPKPAEVGQTLTVILDNITSGHSYFLGFRGRPEGSKTCTGEPIINSSTGRTVSTSGCTLNLVVPDGIRASETIRVRDDTSGQEIVLSDVFKTSSLGSALDDECDPANPVCPDGNMVCVSDTDDRNRGHCQRLRDEPFNFASCNLTCSEDEECVKVYRDTLKDSDRNAQNDPFDSNCSDPSNTIKYKSCLVEVCRAKQESPCAIKRDGKCMSFASALGINIDTSVGGFVKSLMGVLLSLSGGIALIIIVITGYKIMTSQGDPEKLKESREMFTAAVIGLLFIIFSLVILQFITVDIFKIPGFTK